eukprot:6186897-Pleurochrysis_carterae.AAC.1
MKQVFVYSTYKVWFQLDNKKVSCVFGSGTNKLDIRDIYFLSDNPSRAALHLPGKYLLEDSHLVDPTSCASTCPSPPEDWAEHLANL